MHLQPFFNLNKSVWGFLFNYIWLALWRKKTEINTRRKDTVIGSQWESFRKLTNWDTFQTKTAETCSFFCLFTQPKMNQGKRLHRSTMPKLSVRQEADWKIPFLSDIGNRLLKEEIIRRETTCKPGYTTAQPLNLCCKLMREVNRQLNWVS